MISVTGGKYGIIAILLMGLTIGAGVGYTADEKSEAEVKYDNYQMEYRGETSQLTEIERLDNKLPVPYTDSLISAVFWMTNVFAILYYNLQWVPEWMIELQLEATIIFFIGYLLVDAVKLAYGKDDLTGWY